MSDAAVLAGDLASPSSRAGEIGVLAPLLGFRMRRIHNHLTRAFSSRLGERALKPGGFSALGLIAANPGLSQKMLADGLGQDKTTVVVLLDELERRGWAERRRDVADRRRHYLHVTAQGQAALDWMGAQAIENERDVVEVLTADEARLLLNMLDRIYRRAYPLEGEISAASMTEPCAGSSR